MGRAGGTSCAFCNGLGMEFLVLRIEHLGLAEGGWLNGHIVLQDSDIGVQTITNTIVGGVLFITV